MPPEGHLRGLAPRSFEVPYAMTSEMLGVKMLLEKDDQNSPLKSKIYRALN